MSRSRSVSRGSSPSPASADLQSKQSDENRQVVGTENGLQPQKTVKEASPIRNLYRKLKLVMEDNPKEKADGTITEEEEIADGDFKIAVLAREDGEPYGILGWAPSFLQCCGQSSIGFLFVLCVLCVSATFIQHGAILASTTMWQRRFHFTTYDLAAIRAMYDLGVLIMLAPVIYFDIQGVHRPQWIGIGGVIVGVGAMVVVVPHFWDMKGYHRSNQNQGLCGNQPISSVYTKGNEGYKAVFMIGELLIGMGASSYWTMGITYLDENVSRRQLILCTTMIEICQMIVGPLLGFVAVGQTVKTYGDFDKRDLKSEHFYPGHHHWYGAWWIAIIIGATISWIGAVFMFPFPAQLSGAVVERLSESCEAATQTKEQQEEKKQESEVRVCMGKLKSLLRNRVFLGTMLEEGFRHCMIVGVSTFAVRYLEAAFSSDSVRASMAVGIMLMGTGLTSLLFGSTVQFLFRLDVLGNLRLCLAGTVASIIFAATLFVHCPDLKFDGGGNGVSMNFTRECNLNCTCQMKDFDPICFTPFQANTTNKKEKRRTYFSKCFAGCYEDPINKTNPHCTCFPSMPKKVTAGACSTGCGEGIMYAFLIGLGWTASSLYIRFNCVKQIQLRSVHFNDRAVAMALAEVLYRVINIPSPFVFGSFLRMSCKDDSCTTYHRMIMACTLVALVVFLSTLCLGAVVFAHRSQMQQLQQQALGDLSKTVRSPTKARPSKKKAVSDSPESPARNAGQPDMKKAKDTAIKKPNGKLQSKCSLSAKKKKNRPV